MMVVVSLWDNRQLAGFLSPPGKDTVKRELSPESNHANIVISDFWPLELWENKFLLFKISNLRLFVMTAQADEDIQDIKRRKYASFIGIP